MPIPVPKMISTIVTFFGEKLAKDESIKGFFDDLLEATANELRALFIKDDGTPTDTAAKLAENPDESSSKHKLLAAMIESKLEDKPDLEKSIKQMYEKISQTDEGAKIINSKNVVTGNITAGGDVKIGDTTYNSTGNQGVSLQGVSAGKNININKNKVEE